MVHAAVVCDTGWCVHGCGCEETYKLGWPEPVELHSIMCTVLRELLLHVARYVVCMSRLSAHLLATLVLHDTGALPLEHVGTALPLACR